MGSRKTIIVVEDNPMSMKLIADLLALNGFNVLKAVDGESALTILKDNMPDLILLDIELPDIDGIMVLAKIREDKRFDSVKVIALTAQAMQENEEKIIAAGFDYYITKPIDTKAFIETVRQKVNNT